MGDLMTTTEIMTYLKVCRPTVHRWCREGKLPAVKICKEYRVRRRDLDAWYEGMRRTAA